IRHYLIGALAHDAAAVPVLCAALCRKADRRPILVIDIDAMLRVDHYIQHMHRYHADFAELRSGQPVRFRFPSGERASSKSLEHAQIIELVEQVAPADVLMQLRKQGVGEFVHHAPVGAPVRMHIDASAARAWVVTLQVEAQSAGRPAQSAAGPAAPPPAPARPRAPAPATAEPARRQISATEAQTQPLAKVELGPGGAPDIERLLRAMVRLSASDLHLSAGAPPMLRLHGRMQPVKDIPPLTATQIDSLIAAVIPERNQEEYSERKDSDFAYEIAGVARFRANVFVDRNGPGAVFRTIPFEILPPDKLGLPAAVLDLCWLTKGLVLVTGPTGSGKSTTLATLIDVINQNRADHIITIEDPIEFVHSNKRCLVNQREVGTHTQSFKTALRAALREDPDIVLVGEMRDLETIAIAIETAETGHLVFGTLHTTSAPSTVDRIIDQFPPNQQAQIRVMLSESLRGVIAQVLCRKEGGGRVAAYEVLVANPAVANLIREGKTFQLPSVMQTGKKLGMQTMNDHLLKHVQAGRVAPEEAYLKSNNKLQMRDTLAREGFALSLQQGA
ncbi:MAG: type IV pilus twitching motility protein PilT, partial [Polyangiales bacterium]